VKRRNICSMKWRVPDPKVDQRGLEERVCKNERPAYKMNRGEAMDRSRWRWLIKGWLMIMIGVNG